MFFVPHQDNLKQLSMKTHQPEVHHIHQQPHTDVSHQPAKHDAHTNYYRKLLVMAVLSFVAMYFLMYAMVDSFSNVFHSVNQFYMALLMTAAMILIELLVMRAMYKNRKRNALILVLSAVALVFSFVCIRQQAAVSDKQFLRSMIPHHAGAVLMVGETELQDPELQELARGIISSQQQEIEFMKTKLKQLEAE
jgi:cation transport ATPase